MSGQEQEDPSLKICRPGGPRLILIQQMELLLYQYESCPYCRKVSRFIQKEGISLPMKDTLKDKSAREELRRIGGKTQVPCLVIDGSALYESDDIIAWLRERSEQLKPAKV